MLKVTAGLLRQAVTGRKNERGKGGESHKNQISSRIAGLFTHSGYCHSLRPTCKVFADIDEVVEVGGRILLWF